MAASPAFADRFLGEGAPSPNPAKDSSDGVFERSKASFEPLYGRFRVKTRRYERQFSHLYTRRLAQLRGAVTASAKANLMKHGEKLSITAKIIDLTVGKEQIAVGTLYKDMKLKPNVLDDFSHERSLAPVERAENFVDESDTLVLEDESGRVALVGSRLPIGDLVTGVVCAVRGVVLPSGELKVSGIAVAGPNKPPKPVEAAREGASYALLVSGLGAGGDSDPLPLELLAEFVGGFLGGSEEQRGVSRIARVIVCGNIVHREESKPSSATVTAKDQETLMEPMKAADLVLSQLAAAVPVDVMPGEKDPANYTMPQQPMHPCLFPLAARYSSFQTVTNPFEASLDGVRLLGSAGQPVSDILRYTSAVGKPGVWDTAPSLPEERGKKKKKAATAAAGAGAGGAAADADMEGEAGAGAAPTPPTHMPSEGREKLTTAELSLHVLASTLSWRHMAPTAPDTLGCYPFYDTDPFVLEESPHVYFAGNQPEFATRMEGGVRIISVPEFATTRTAVLVDLATLEAEPITFAGVDAAPEAAAAADDAQMEDSAAGAGAGSSA